MLEALADGEPFRLFGDGEQPRGASPTSATPSRRRSLAMERGRAGEIYNVGGGDEATMNEAIALAERISGRKLDVERTASGARRRPADEGGCDEGGRGARLVAADRRSKRDADAVGVGGGRVARVNTPPDLDAEQEVDLRSVWERIAARWWLPVLGVVLGLLIGFALALGGGKVYQAETLVAMGQPFSPNGGAPVQSFLTNARAVSEIVRSESALEKAAHASGLRVRALRGNISSAIVGASGPGARPTGAPLVTITVIAGQPLKAEKAADALAEEVIRRTSAQYVDTKITAFNDQLASIQDQLDTLVPRIAQLERGRRTKRASARSTSSSWCSSLDNAQQRRGQLLDLQSDVRQQLALAENVEKAQVVEPAAAVKTTARSGRNGALVGGLIGLLLGLRGGAPRRPVLRAPHTARA